MTKEITLTQGKVALVDDEDYESLSAWKWQANRRNQYFYAARSGERPSRKRIYMHMVIAGAPAGFWVDHINGNFLDNRRENLRICTRAQNGRNRKRNENSTTGFKGVSRASVNRYKAEITIDRQKIYLGSFETAEAAARAYDAKAIELFGEFARTNF